MRIRPVLMAYPLEQGLKLLTPGRADRLRLASLNGLSTRTRIETAVDRGYQHFYVIRVLMAYPLEQGLKPVGNP